MKHESGPPTTISYHVVGLSSWPKLPPQTFNLHLHLCQKFFLWTGLFCHGSDKRENLSIRLLFFFFLSRSTRHLFYISPGYASEAEMNEDVVDFMVDAMIEGGSIRLRGGAFIYWYSHKYWASALETVKYHLTPPPHIPLIIKTW